MKVALIDPSLFTWPYDSALALSLQAAGHQVRIFGKPLPDAEQRGDATELLVPHFYRKMGKKPESRLARVWFFAQKGVSHTAAMFSLLSELRAFGPDVIHFQWTPLPIVDRWFLSTLRAIAPLVLTVHDSMPFNGNALSFLQAAGAISIMKRFDRLLVHTEQAASRLREYGVAAERIRRVPHGTLDEAPGLVVAPIVSPKPAASADAQVSVLLFGRIKPYKGADVLVRAAARLSPAQRQKLRLRIVGEAFMDLEPLHELIRAADLSSNVEIDARFLSEAEVDSLLASADIIALPYREIDASGVLMKSLAAGVPIVASNIGLFAEMLVDGEHGRLVGSGDDRALADALGELLDDATLRARMGRAVRKLRDQIPSWETIAGVTESIYRELGEPPLDLAHREPGVALRSSTSGRMVVEA